MFVPGQLIVFEGNPLTAIYFINRGLVQLLERTMPVGTLRDNDSFGLDDYTIGQQTGKSPVVGMTAKALGYCDVMTLPLEKLTQAVRDDQELKQRFANTKSRQPNDSGGRTRIACGKKAMLSMMGRSRQLGRSNTDKLMSVRSARTRFVKRRNFVMCRLASTVDRRELRGSQSRTRRSTHSSLDRYPTPTRPLGTTMHSEQSGRHIALRMRSLVERRCKVAGTSVERGVHFLLCLIRLYTAAPYRVSTTTRRRFVDASSPDDRDCHAPTLQQRDSHSTRMSETTDKIFQENVNRVDVLSQLVDVTRVTRFQPV